MQKKFSARASRAPVRTKKDIGVCVRRQVPLRQIILLTLQELLLLRRRRGPRWLPSRCAVRSTCAVPNYLAPHRVRIFLPAPSVRSFGKDPGAPLLPSASFRENFFGAKRRVQAVPARFCRRRGGIASPPRFDVHVGEPERASD